MTTDPKLLNEADLDEYERQIRARTQSAESFDRQLTLLEQARLAIELREALLAEQACRKIAETANEAMAKRIADVGAAAKWLRDNVEFLQITPATVVAYDSGRGLEDGCEVCCGQLASDTGEAFCDALIELKREGGA